jgi:hypothetical protein
MKAVLTSITVLVFKNATIFYFILFSNALYTIFFFVILFKKYMFHVQNCRANTLIIEKGASMNNALINRIHNNHIFILLLFCATLSSAYVN